MTGVLFDVISAKPFVGLAFAAATVVLGAILLGSLRVRDLRHRRREQCLEIAVRERTEELESERVREGARNRVLEMLVSNQSLGIVLDAIAKLIRDEVQGTHCAILLKQLNGCHVGAAPGFPKEWLTALSAQHAIPFEVWRQPCQFRAPEFDPAWKTFRSQVGGSIPVAIDTQPIGSVDLALGAILLFHDRPLRRDTSEPEICAETLESAARIAQVAVEHRRLYDDLQFQAHHDGLTGLPNRTLFEDRLALACGEARNLDRQLAVLFVDLDRFKQINDTMSHRVGDLLLCEIAARMRRAVRPVDTVARIGGDEFNVLLTNISSPAEAQDVGERILAAIRQPAVVDGRTVTVSASLGLALFPGDGDDVDLLQRQADAAMYCAKGLGRDRVQSFSTRNEKLDRVRLDQELRLALRDKLFEVHYQPKIGVDGKLRGLEALLRLNHPVHGRIPPAEFIPVAEETGLIVPLGTWVLDEACRQIAEWRAKGLDEIAVAVNVSSIQLARPDFAKQVQSCLGRHAVAPWLIELELTESLLMGGGEASHGQMQELRALGIRFSIDDFGTGYSSLSYLHRLQVDAIKLDRSFVQSIDTDPAAKRLVQAMIGVAEGLGLGVIAEGVETEDQRCALVAAGCSTMQGFLFSRPQPAAELEGYLRELKSGAGDLMRIAHSTSSVSKASFELQAV